MRDNIPYIDIHSHLNFAAFDLDREEVLSRALDGGVYSIQVGTQKDTSRSAVELARKYEKGVYAIVGVHPIHTGKSFHDKKELGEEGGEFTSRGEVFDYEYYKELASDRKVIGIGECGLDYYRLEGADQEKQHDAFFSQITLANEMNKPLMLHVRNGAGYSAYKDALMMLKKHARSGGNFHFFAGTVEEAKEILEAGFYFSFTGVITFARDYDEVVKYIPMNRILSETDSPYVAPSQHRGKRNEPIFVKEVVSRIALIKGKKEDEVKEAIFKNAETLFGISS